MEPCEFTQITAKGMSKSDGVTIISSEKDKYLNTVLNTIEKIRENNPTVLPDDIGIIFMENSNDNFELASKLQLLIREKYNWKVNIGYETKEKVEGTLFISNRNNVKGLEFPFVICIMQNALTYNYSIGNILGKNYINIRIVSFIPSRRNNLG